MIKHGKIKSLIWTILFIGMVMTAVLLMGMMQRDGTSREYQGAVFAGNLSDGAVEEQWIQLLFI